MQSPSTSLRGRLVRRASLAALLAIVSVAASCGGGESPTGAPPSLTLDIAGARPGEVISARVRGAVLPTVPVAGQLDTFAVRAARVDDSTLALVVPDVAPGARQLRLTIGRAELAATLQVTASQLPADPVVFADTVLDRAETELAASAAALTSDATLAAGVDTAAFRRSRSALVAEMAAIREQLAALTPVERAEAAMLVAANLPALRDAMQGSVPSASRVASAGATGAAAPALQDHDDACTAGANCAAALTGFLRNFKRSAVKLGIVLLGLDIASTVGGPGVKVGARIMNALAVGSFLGSQTTGIMEWFVKPMIARIAEDFESENVGGVEHGLGSASLGSASLVTLTSPFTSDRPAAVPVMATYRSITSGDLGQSAFAALATAYEEMRATWNALAEWVPLFDLAAPAIPASPPRTVRRGIPPTQLALGAIATPNVTATASASGELWLVTFSNPLQGTDRPVNFGVRFLPPGLPEQAAAYRITLRPAQYVVASVELTPSHDSIPHNSTLQMAAVARDSLDKLVTDQPVTWASSRTSVASVNGTGLVSGHTIDTVTVSATVGGKRGARRMRVVGDPLAGYTLEIMDYHPTYEKASVEQVLQPRQTFTAMNGIVYYMRLAYEGQPVSGWQQRWDFANETRYPLGTQDHHVPGMQLAFTDTLRKRSVGFLLNATLSNAGYRAMAGRTVTVTQANSDYKATYTIDPSQIRNGHVGHHYWENCTTSTSTLEFKKTTMAAIAGGFYPASYIIVYEDGTMGLNSSYSCPNRPDRYIVQ